MKKILLALVLLGGLATLSGCAGYKWACDKVDGAFDPATGDCDKNLFG